jgi:hypothetical protein
MEAGGVVETWAFTLVKRDGKSKWDYRYEVKVVIRFVGEHLHSVEARSNAGDLLIECKSTVDVDGSHIDLVLDLVEKLFERMKVASVTRRVEITEELA